MSKQKFMVLGHARHGKDTVSQILCDEYGLTFQSSSHFVAEKVCRPWLKNMGITYPSLEACYADRGNHRADWFNAIAAYNTPNGYRLAEELFKSFDIYCGLRNPVELEAIKKHLKPTIFWVDASKRLPPEDKSSMGITADMCDYIIDNNGPEENLLGTVKSVFEYAKARQTAKSVIL